MKTNRSLKILDNTNRHRHKKQSNSPTLASSYSQKQLWAKSFKNEPFPRELKRRLIGHKFKFSDFSDEQQDNNGVVVEEEQTEVLQKKKILPHFKLISDNGQFLASRNRIKSAQKFFSHSSPRCKSVQSLRLPQVMEQKRQEDDLQKLELSKLSQFTDKNEFGQHSMRYSQNNSIHAQEKDSLEPNAFIQGLPQRIIQNEAEETKSVKLKNQRSMLDDQLDKLIVDEMDQKKKKKDDAQPQIEEIIQEERNEEDTQIVNRLRVSLERFEQQAQFLNKFKDQQFKISHRSSQNSQSSHCSGRSKTKTIKHHQHQDPITQYQGHQQSNNL